jgi:hypothetical protein
MNTGENFISNLIRSQLACRTRIRKRLGAQESIPRAYVALRPVLRVNDSKKTGVRCPAHWHTVFIRVKEAFRHQPIAPAL